MVNKNDDGGNDSNGYGDCCEINHYYRYLYNGNTIKCYENTNSNSD